MMNNIGVHASHCCKWHGCKYGDPDCPVVSGEVKQEYLCEWCYDDLEHEDYYKQRLQDLEEIKRFIKENENEQ